MMSTASWRDRVEQFLTAITGICWIAGFLVESPWIDYLGVATGAWFALGAAWASIRERSIDVNLLMVAAAAGAIAVGHPEDAVALLFLFSLSHTLEHFALGRTESAIAGLMKLRPERALRRTEDGETWVALDQLVKGDFVRIPAFETVPVDGVIREGESSVDLSTMTGESVPVAVSPGAKVLTGTQNLEGTLLVEVSALPGESTLDRIVALVQNAQANRASGERISAWFGQRYTILVVTAFLVSLLIRTGLGVPISEALYASLVLLVALSPCALVISTPASTLSALAYAARRGILVRGGAFLEALGRIRVVALDKTGTLTLGRPELVVIVTEDGAEAIPAESLPAPHRSFLTLAASAERYSQHPLAVALLESSQKLGLPSWEASEHRVLPGMGVTAEGPEGTIMVAKPKAFPNLSREFRAVISELLERGLTVAVVECGGAHAAMGFQDQLRREALPTIRELRDLKVEKVAMLTGDSQATARVIADCLSLDEVHAELLPDQKLALVEAFEKRGERVMMVGDGVNDAPSLTRASVGVAMGGLGSDIALNSADVVLMRDDLRALPELIRLGRKTNRVIRANLIFAAGVIVALTVASFVVTLPLPIAVLGHEGSTVLVILNGLRLLAGPGR